MYLDISDLIPQIIENIERKFMKHTQRVMETINSMEQPVTMKQLLDATELTPGILSGTLHSLCRQGKLSKEKVERSDNLGPKMKFVYKVVANPQQAS